MIARLSIPLIALLIAAMPVVCPASQSEPPGDASLAPGEQPNLSTTQEPPAMTISARNLAEPDERIRGHLQTAHRIFDVKIPGPAADEIFKATVLLRRQLALNDASGSPTPAADLDRGAAPNIGAPVGQANPILDGAPEGFGDVLATGDIDRKTDAPTSPALASTTNDKDELHRTVQKQARRMQNAIRQLEEFNMRLADGKIESIEEFRDPYDRIYRESTAYHFQLACKAVRTRPVDGSTGFDPFGTQRRGSLDDAGRVVHVADTIDDSRSGHGWNRAPIGKPTSTDPAYHARQTAEYFKSWAALWNREIDDETKTVLNEVEKIAAMPRGSSDPAALPEVLGALGEQLNENGIDVPAAVTDALKDDLPAAAPSVDKPSQEGKNGAMSR
jgi:hypothetical protein